jgi:hypothetical protein
MLAGERAVDVQIAQTEAAAAGVEFEIGDGPVLRPSRIDQARFQHARGFRPLARENRRDAGLQDAGLFSGDGFQALAQERFVVEIDGRDHGEIGNHHVGGVEAPAESHFEHHHIDALFGEDRERHGGDGFEVGGVHVDLALGEQRFHARVNAVEGAGEAFGGDGHAVDADALGGFGQVRRGEQAGAAAGGAQADSSMAQTEPLPLVPATWTKWRRSCGRPRASRTARMRSRPNLAVLISLPSA